MDAVHEGPAHFRVTDIEDQYIHIEEEKYQAGQESGICDLPVPVFPVSEAGSCYKDDQ